MQRLTNSLSTRQRLGSVINQVFLALCEQLKKAKLIGFNMKQRQKDELTLVTIGAIVLFVALYYFIKAIVGFDN